MKNEITVQSLVKVSPEKAWNMWTDPAHITQWCNASPDWHAPRAKNDVRLGGKFVTRMEAKDGSAGFDFGGIYTAVETGKLIKYEMGEGGRKARVEFLAQPKGVMIVEKFEPETENSREMQQGGWQAILDNFKRYAEEN